MSVQEDIAKMLENIKLPEDMTKDDLELVLKLGLENFKTIGEHIKSKQTLMEKGKLDINWIKSDLYREDHEKIADLTEKCTISEKKVIELNETVETLQNTLKDATLSFRKSVKDKSFDFEKSHKELANQELNMRESGCLSLDLAYVGAGRLDGVWAHNINLIDFAAGTLIAQEGGALVSNFKGDPKYMDDNKIAMIVDEKSIIMSNSKLDLTDEIIKILNTELKTLNLN